VNEQLNTAIRFDRKCVVGFKNLTDGTINRRNHFVTGRFDSNAITNNFLCKHDIRHVFDVDDFTRQRSNNLNSSGVAVAFVTEQFTK